MGPAGGDEFNLIEAGRNYGWPNVSEGDNYDGTPIPRHATNPSYAAPLFSWNPVIAPGGMIQYHGTRFSGWAGDFILAGLVQQGIVRVRVSGTPRRRLRGSHWEREFVRSRKRLTARSGFCRTAPPPSSSSSILADLPSSIRRAVLRRKTAAIRRA